MSILVFFFIFFNSKLKIFHIFQPKNEKEKKRKKKFWAKLEKKTYKKNQFKAQLV